MSANKRVIRVAGPAPVEPTVETFPVFDHGYVHDGSVPLPAVLVENPPSDLSVSEAAEGE